MKKFGKHLLVHPQASGGSHSKQARACLHCVILLKAGSVLYQATSLLWDLQHFSHLPHLPGPHFVHRKAGSDALAAAGGRVRKVH